MPMHPHVDQQLDDFRREVSLSLACGALADVDLPVTGDDGGCPVIVALEHERLATVLGRLRAAGGFANLFVRDDDGRVRMTSVMRENCAISDPDDTMTGDERPGADATVGMFLDFVARNPRGVVLSAAVGHPACARDARTVEFPAAL